VDEVHAYDNYMYGLLEEVIREQKKLGGSVILLSATLPLIQKEKLLKAWGTGINEETPPKETPYPLITSSLLEEPVTVAPREHPKAFDVSVELSYSKELAFTDETISQIVKFAKSGASICVICNVVADAQSLAKKVSEKVPNNIEVDIFHSRYRFEDRKKKEDAVIKQYGKDGERKGRILIATQVVEQSLDIDFDWMVTQHCPADLLFQRLGRLHRHSKHSTKRPFDFKDRKITVILPENELEYGGTGMVYKNVLALWKTQKLLESTNIIAFPKAYREWIEEVYDEDTAGTSQKLQDLNNTFIAENDSRHCTANQLTKSRDTITANRSDDATSLTRDGEMSISLIPTLNDDTLLDGTQLSKLKEWERWETLSLNSIPVPSGKSWKPNFVPYEDGYMKIEMKKKEDSFETEIGNYRFTYTTERGLERTEA
jgi:CRISPR-associated endonuclease/helicase Cas3